MKNYYFIVLFALALVSCRSAKDLSFNEVTLLSLDMSPTEVMYLNDKYDFGQAFVEETKISDQDLAVLANDYPLNQKKQEQLVDLLSDKENYIIARITYARGKEKSDLIFKDKHNRLKKISIYHKSGTLIENCKMAAGIMRIEANIDSITFRRNHQVIAVHEVDWQD